MAAKFPPVKPPPSIQPRPICCAAGASWWLLLAVVGATQGWGCSTRGASAPAVSRGASSEPAVGLVYLPVAPSGSFDLGPVNARCDRAKAVSSRQRIDLARLDCSMSLLRRLLEERAFSLGATALASAVCPEHPDGATIDCEAKAIQVPSHMSGALAPTSALATTELPAASTVFRTTVRFVPWGELGSAQNPVSQAQEVSSPLAADRKLGVLQVTVLAPTSRDEAVKCVGLAAKHFRAAHFGTPSCVAEPHPNAWSCTSELFAPDVDERKLAKLR